MKTKQFLLKLLTIFTAIQLLLTFALIPSAAVAPLDESENVEELIPMTAQACPLDADDFFTDPALLGSYTPESLYYSLQGNYNVVPLSMGSFAGVPFSAGGGYKINWGGDKLLEYHPAGSLYHNNGEPYYKISSGKYGTRRYNLAGQPIY